MRYLAEQRDVVLDAIRYSKDILASRREPWRTTIWTRNAHDAEKLREMMHAPVFEQARDLAVVTAVTIGLVESRRIGPGEAPAQGARWGVLVELHCQDDLDPKTS